VCTHRAGTLLSPGRRGDRRLTTEGICVGWVVKLIGAACETVRMTTDIRQSATSAVRMMITAVADAIPLTGQASLVASENMTTVTVGTTDETGNGMSTAAGTEMTLGSVVTAGTVATVEIALGTGTGAMIDMRTSTESAGAGVTSACMARGERKQLMGKQMKNGHDGTRYSGWYCMVH
jgi:hypothetical protein